MDDKKFEYIYKRGPIDFWGSALIANWYETVRVLDQMPETPRDDVVYKLMVPRSGEPELYPIFLCKQENNGDVWIFADFDIKEIFNDLVKRRN